MKKKRTKKDFLTDTINKKQEDIWLMETVRDHNRTKGTPQAETEADAADKRIKDIEIELTFLNEYIKTCEF